MEAMMLLEMKLLMVFAVVLLVLITKAQILGAATAATRGKLKKFITKEDANWQNGEWAYPDDPQVYRLYRAHQNDLESLLPFFIVGSLYLVSEASQIAGAFYFTLFAIARVCHTFFYLTKRPGARRNSFTLGWLLNFIIGFHALWALLF